MLNTESLTAWLNEAQAVAQAHAEDEGQTEFYRGMAYTLTQVLKRLDSFEEKPPAQATFSALARRTSVESRVRKHSEETSWEAAISQTPEKSFAYYRLIYRALSIWGPLTDEELHERLDRKGIVHSVSGLRARRSELRTAGWVQDSGIKRHSVAGHPMIVWSAVESKKVAA